MWNGYVARKGGEERGRGGAGEFEMRESVIRNPNVTRVLSSRMRRDRLSHL